MRPSIQLIGPRPAKIGELAVKAEAAGFEAAGLPSPYGFYTGMGVLAEATNEILLASSILPLFHASPYMHAASSIMMQEVTNGRFILGVGSQTKGQVRTQVGIDPESPAKMARDMVLAIQSLMNGEGHYEGEYYKLNTGPRLVIHSTGKKPPPIYFSGVNALMLGLSGELCDGMLAHPIFSKKDFEDVVWPLVDKGLKKSNKQRDDFKMCALPMIWVLGEGTDRAEAYSRGKRNLANYFSTKAYSGYMDSHGWSKEKEQIREVWSDAMKSGKPIDGDMMEDILSEDIVDEVCIIGDPQEVREKVIERYDGLADSLYFYAFHDSFPTRSDEEEGIKVEQNLLRVIDAFKDFK